jgi:DNA-binding NtrC family response regulator
MNRPVVLVIEDEPSVMAFIATALERNGYAVEAAETGTRGVELLRMRGYAGVISDMRTPGGIDGAGVWSWIAANRPEMLDKIIFVTGDIVNEETATTLRRTGAPYVEKPFRVQQLISTLEKILTMTP